MGEPEDQEKSFKTSSGHGTAIAVMISGELWLPGLGLHKTGPVNSHSGIKAGFIVSCASQLGWWVLGRGHCLQLLTLVRLKEQ